MYDINSLNKDFNIEYFLQEDVCRLCWKQGAIIKIVSVLEENIIATECTKRKKYCLLEDITNCLSIKNETDLPKQLCLNCYKNVKKFNKFKVFCQESDRRLHALFKSKTVNTSYYKEIENIKYGNHSEQDLQEITEINEQNTTPENPQVDNKTFCFVCNINLCTENNLTKHEQDYHNFLNCYGCKNIFMDKIELSSHEIECESLKFGYKCLQCDDVLKTRKDYEQHMYGHRVEKNLEVTCDICNLNFQNDKFLKNHLKIHKLEKRKKVYVCEHCGRGFARVDYLHKHRLTHTGVKTYSCEHCAYRTAQKSSLSVHIRKHTGVRPFACDRCPRRCVSSSNLAAHRRRHDQLKEYECTMCNKKFGYKQSLNDHMVAAHQVSERHDCHICSASYIYKKGLRRHFLKEHKHTTVNLAGKPNAKVDFGGKTDNSVQIMSDLI